ncbi:MAG: peptidase M20 [Anaerolineaceae bacterium]|nr:peptidase M20 [Anaerolineaceae bacterium]
MTNNLDLALHEFNYSKNLRREFHQFPELGFQEFRTSKIVAETLSSLGYRVITGIAKTGVVGLLPGKLGSPTIMLRFDMDALPVLEKNETDYASKNLGIMHACGHDAHMAIGLTVAKILVENKDKVNATIKLVFQPAEEGLGGAEAMIQADVLKNPKPDYCIGAHVWNEKPLGWVGLSAGPIMAGADTFEIKITGKGGHGGHPHETIDPIPAAAQIISATQTIISRNLSPLENAVISFCSMNGGTTFNVIPDQVTLSGTIRTYLPSVRDTVIRRLEEIIQHTALAYQCQADLIVDSVTPAVINNKEVVDKITQPISEHISNIKIDTEIKSMVSEDFAFFLNQIPGCFIFVGSAKSDKALNFGHHHPKFDIDKGVLPIAVAVFLEAVEALSASQI